jgi:hypothetical protein
LEFSAVPALNARVLKLNRLDRFVELSWLAVVVAAGGGCGSRVEPADVGATKGDAGPALRGHVGDGDGGGGAPDAETDLPPTIDASPVTDATVPVDAITTPDVAPVIDANRADSGKPDAGPPDVTPDVPPRQCTAPAKRCVGLVPQTCDTAGAWQSAQACPFLCVAGACAGVCAPGSNQCVGGDLQTCDAGGAWQSTGTSTRELLVNPAFDLDLNETGWTNPGIPIVYAAPTPGGGVTNHPDVAAQSLPNLAWFGGLDNSDDRLSQSIAIPAGATNLTFRLFYAVVTGKTNVTEIDTFDASLLAGAQVISLAHISNLNATDTWTPVSVTLPAALAGQTVTLQLRGVTNANANRLTSFYIDTMSLSAVACP